jgi:hypothetical protein
MEHQDSFKPFNPDTFWPDRKDGRAFVYTINAEIEEIPHNEKSYTDVLWELVTSGLDRCRS